MRWAFESLRPRGSIAFFFIGGAAATMICIEFATPQADLVSADTYNRLVTMHGIIMVWFFLIPSIPNTLGNFIAPLTIGARDLAFPRLNLSSWCMFMVGGGRSTLPAALALMVAVLAWAFELAFTVTGPTIPRGVFAPEQDGQEHDPGGAAEISTPEDAR